MKLKPQGDLQNSFYQKRKPRLRKFGKFDLRISCLTSMFQVKWCMSTAPKGEAPALCSEPF